MSICSRWDFAEEPFGKWLRLEFLSPYLRLFSFCDYTIQYPKEFVYSQISAFNESIILVDTLLGISLDKYMGEDYPLYKRFYYDYQCRSMRPERIVPDCFAFYLLSRYGMNYHEGTCLIDLMMHSGKINYVVQNLLGYSDIGEAMGYSKEENDWCKENEKEIWNYICTNRIKK